MDWLRVGVDFAQVFSGLAALVAAIVATVTLKEMKRQREASYQPDLAIKSSFAHFRFMENDGALSGYWAPDTNGLLSLDDYQSDGSLGIPAFCLDVVNVGNGVAKNLKVEFDFEIDACIEYVNSQFYRQGEIIAIYSLPDGGITYRNSDGSKGIILAADLNTFVDYALPTNIDPSGVRIKLPLPITTAISLFYWAYFRAADRRLDESVVAFKCRMEFSDIGGRMHRQEFQLYPQLHSLSGGPDFPEGVISLSARIGAGPS